MPRFQHRGLAATPIDEQSGYPLVALPTCPLEDGFPGCHSMGKSPLKKLCNLHSGHSVSGQVILPFDASILEKIG